VTGRDTPPSEAPQPPMFDDEWYDDDQEPDRTCKNCGGTGGEPYDDYITPCEECDGEGYYWWL